MNAYLRSVSIGLLLILSFRTITARADSTDGESDETPAYDRNSFHGKAEVGLGLLGLPTAKVCTNRLLPGLGCKRGDSSPMLELWQLFRPSPLFAFGAGITIGLFPITDAPKNEPPGVSRDHKRGYFTAEGIARFYWLHGPVWESWIGVTGGGVVVSDTYATNNNVTDRAYIGPRGITIRSEGYTLGFATGVTRSLSEAWTLGATLRYGLWSLPATPARDTLGDEASLIGRVATFVIGIKRGIQIEALRRPVSDLVLAARHARFARDRAPHGAREAIRTIRAKIRSNITARNTSKNTVRSGAQMG